MSLLGDFSRASNMCDAFTRREPAVWAMVSARRPNLLDPSERWMFQPAFALKSLLPRRFRRARRIQAVFRRPLMISVFLFLIR